MSFLGGLESAGLGNARGSITIDTSQARTAAGQMQRVGEEINRAMGRAASGVQQLGGELASGRQAITAYNAALNQYQQAIRSAFAQGGLGRVLDSQEVLTAARNLDRATTNLRKLRQEAALLSRINLGLGQFRGELASVGLAGGIVTGLGLRTSGGLEEAQIQLEGIAGSEERAIALMEEFRQQAAEAGVPLSDMLTFANQLLPTLEGNTKELERFFDLSRRLATRRPSEGLAGAAFAINEALSSGGTDLISLAERFGIARNVLRDAIEETGSFAAGLDLVLNQMGATSEVADRMGQTFNASFRAARDAAMQLLAEGFTPLLNALTPLLQQTAAWAAELRQTNPGIATFGASVAAIAAVGAPSLLLLTQLVEAGQKLQALGLLGGLGRLGVAGAAIAVGGGLGIGASRVIGQATGNEDMANATLGSVMNTLRQVADIIAAGVVVVLNTLTTGMAQAVRIFLNGAAAFREGFATLLFGLSRLLPDRLGGSELEDFSLSLFEGAEAVREFGDKVTQHAEETTQRNMEWLQGIFERTAAQAPIVNVNVSTGGTRDAGGFTSEQTEAIHEWAQAVQQIERDAAQARLDATRSYEQQRTDVIAQYELTIAREAEDFARQRLRAQQQLERSIADVRDDAARREADWWEDLNRKIADLQGDTTERIADLREESAERIEDIERDHARRMEELQRNHRLSILEAASRLDARAIAQEQRQFNNQVQSLNRDLEERKRAEQESLQERIEQEQENLQERIEQEQEAHAERLQDAREADERRIQDLRESFEEQQRVADEDRRIRLERMAEDHQRQLQQMARAQADRLRQIDQQAAEERRRLDQAFAKELAQLGIKNQKWLTLQKKEQDASLKLFEEFWDKFEKEIRDRYNKLPELSNQGTSAGGTRPIRPNSPVPFRQGGVVDYTGLAMVHGSPASPEYVLSPETTLALRRLMGGQFSQADLVRALGGMATAGVPTERGRDIPGIQLPRFEMPNLQASLPEEIVSALATMTRGAIAPQPQPALAMAGGGSSRSVTLNLASGAIQVNESSRPGTTANEVRGMLLQIINEATSG